ncbi:MAG TPA: hypothetical protein VFE88_01540 [Candidatus Nanoarchaeia archaeon]|nr:hypothetical protein [Candidatus Nanoarchaeia archaeon]
MSLTQIVEKENVSPIAEDRKYEIKKNDKPKIYSPKLDRYVALDSGNPKGEIQKYNIGMGPGSWY